MIIGRFRKMVDPKIIFLIILVISLFIFSSNCVRITFAQGDLDGDGIPDIEDNCPTVYNPDQVDITRLLHFVCSDALHMRKSLV